mmetsp:Transcript_72463/g.161024  ORF Transcript_72463/g.161024 Transcript_72463/m.161024 type:complete len:358 (+) Transcript_72463:95-1168(+)
MHTHSGVSCTSGFVHTRARSRARHGNARIERLRRVWQPVPPLHDQVVLARHVLAQVLDHLALEVDVLEQAPDLVRRRDVAVDAVDVDRVDLQHDRQQPVGLVVEQHDLDHRHGGRVQVVLAAQLVADVAPAGALLEEALEVAPIADVLGVGDAQLLGQDARRLVKLLRVGGAGEAVALLLEVPLAELRQRELRQGQLVDGAEAGVGLVRERVGVAHHDAGHLALAEELERRRVDQEVDLLLLARLHLSGVLVDGGLADVGRRLPRVRPVLLLAVLVARRVLAVPADEPLALAVHDAHALHLAHHVPGCRSPPCHALDWATLLRFLVDSAGLLEGEPGGCHRRAPVPGLSQRGFHSFA